MDIKQSTVVHIRIGSEYVKDIAMKNPGIRLAARVPNAKPSLLFKSILAKYRVIGIEKLKAKMPITKVTIFPAPKVKHTAATTIET